MTGLVIVGWNVRQGGGARCRDIVRALGDLETDVAVISEHRATGRGRLEELLAEQAYVHRLGGEDPTGGHTGLLVASRRPMDVGPITFDSALDGHRFRHVTVAGWQLACCYIPGSEPDSSRKQDFWQFLLDVAEPALRSAPAVLIGDLNTGMHYRDEPGATFACSEALVELEHRGWTDAWISRNPQKRPPASWWSPGHRTPYRLDHALLSPASRRATCVDYPTSLDSGALLGGKDALSDHTPLVLTLPT